MSNNKGQTLVLFIICIPIFLILTAFVIEGFLIAYEKAHLSSLTRTIIKNNIDNVDNNIIIETFKKNNVNEKININDNEGLQIDFEHKIDSFFGKIIGKNNYIIKINLKGTTNGDRLIIEKGS